MHSDITFIASDLLAAEKVQNILRESPANCQVVLSNTQDLEEVSRSQVAQGAKVLIAFGMFAKIVRQSVDVPVIMVDLQAEDVMDALLEASKLGKRIAIFGFRRVLKDVFYVRDLLSIDLVWLPTVSPEKIPHELEKVQDIDVLVGGYYQARIAKQYGIPTVLIKTRDSEIRKAISLAQSYLEKRQDESETGTPMMESSIYAAITVDCLGEILMMNRLASEYLKLDQLNAVAFSVDDVCPQFSRIADVISTRRPYLNQIAKLEDRIFLYHAEPILRKRDGTLEGVSVIFQDVNTVMSSEVSIRRTLTTKENQAVYSFDHILGNSPCMTQALRLALRYSKVDETVLIQGETGVGKEMFAQGIHRASRRRDMPFVAVNCASLPESILERELFGYVKGAFTGASRDGKRGLSTISAAGQGIGLGLAAEEYSARFFSNGMLSKIALTYPGKLDPKVADDLREFFDARYTGTANHHRPLLLTEGGEAKTLSMSAEDAQLIESRQFSVIDICRFFGVPPVMIGETEKTSSWGSGVEQMARWFTTFTLNDHLTAIEQELEAKLFRDGFVAEFAESGLARGDTKTRGEFYRIARGSMQEPGFMTTNEIRAAEGLPPIDGGDELQHPVKKDENGQTVETPTRQRPEQDGQPPKS